jgi:SAM-dependent methyltransferase
VGTLNPAEPRLYSEFASWFHLLTAPEDYADEAALYTRLIAQAIPAAATMLELGSGGGNNASHLKKQFELTLVDRSPEMLELSRSLNPECDHVVGDMRNVRLGRTFDAVFVHDAVAYIVSESELRDVAATAFVHCRPGGAALFVPDFVRERFRELVHHGGHDAGGRGLRYLQWTRDPDPGDSTYVVDFAYLFSDEAGVRVEHDTHVCGLFSRRTWLEILTEAGFRAEAQAASDIDHEGGELFLARQPSG